MNKQISYLHISVYKNNFFFILSNRSGQVFFTINSGSLGYRNIQKRSVEALMSLLEVCFKKIVLLKKPCLFFKLERVKLNDSKII
jgi:ribosomal protein S11